MEALSLPILTLFTKLIWVAYIQRNKQKKTRTEHLQINGHQKKSYAPSAGIDPGTFRTVIHRLDRTAIGAIDGVEVK